MTTAETLTALLARVNALKAAVAYYQEKMYDRRLAPATALAYAAKRDKLLAELLALRDAYTANPQAFN